MNLDRESALLRVGTYSTPLGDLVVERKDSNFLITFDDRSGYRASWLFDASGKFVTFGSESVNVVPSEKVSVLPGNDAVIVCSHISPDYSGEVFVDKNDPSKYVCPRCTTKQINADTAIKLIDRKLWEKCVVPCIVINQL